MKVLQYTTGIGLAGLLAAAAPGCGANAPGLDSVGENSQPSVLIAQTPLPGVAIPKYVDAVPTFSGQRVNPLLYVSVSMEEFQQKVLPNSIYSGLAAPFDQGTYVWGYKVDSRPPSWPGFTIEVRRPLPLIVNYQNNLRRPDGSRPVLANYLTVDQTLHWADPLGTTHNDNCLKGPPYDPACLQPYQGPIPTTVHLHGGEDQSYFDGHPDTWWTPGFKYRGPSFLTNFYLYPNQQEATTLWFHDHALGITRLNVFAGLSAFYLIRDNRDTGRPSNPIGLPAGPYEQELMIQDRQFDTDGQLLFPDGSPSGLNGPPPNPDIHPYWIPEFFGDVMTVNGKSWPYLSVEPRRYRFRLVDASNARFVQMRLVDQATNAPGPAIWQIGTDGGLLNTPAKVADPADPNSPPLTLGIAERADVIIDFSGQQGKTFVLNNTANAPFPDGDAPDPNTTGQIMQFRVELPLHGTDTSYNPAAPTTSLRARPIVDLKPADTGRPPDKRRQLVLVEVERNDGPVIVLLNNSHWHGKIDETNVPIPGSVSNGGVDFATEAPQVGATEEWEVMNLTDDAHPIHVHLIQFQEIDRQDFNRDGYRAAWDALFPGGTFNGVTYPPGVFIPAYGPPRDYNTPNGAGAVGGNLDPVPYLQGAPLPPPANEAGWKDTIIMLPRQVTRIVARWAPQGTSVNDVSPGVNRFAFDPTAGPGYIWHCHILDHEDNEMMRPYVVVK